MINVFQPSLGKEELERISQVFESNWIGRGKLTIEFEEKFAEYIGSTKEHLVTPIEIKTRQCRLPALEDNTAIAVGRFQDPHDHILKRLFAHDPVGSLLPVRHLIGIETVAATHITKAGGRFDHHLYRRHCLLLPSYRL